ncbi:IS3 family transposase [Mucilaginibacter panaciglaebae]
MKKSRGLSQGKRSPRTHEWAKAIEELRPEHDVAILLDCNKMARSVFYYHRKRLNSDDKYRHEKQEIANIYNLHKGRYGYRRVTAEMKNRGYSINHKTVQKLMGSLGLKCNIRKVSYRSYKGEVGKIAPNVLERNFEASLPNQKWATDVTQMNIKGEKIYLSPIIDMFNGEVISYSISKSPNMQMIDEMLYEAFDKVKDTKGLIFHSDQGWQYQHYGYRKALKKNGIIQSMSRKGNCLDNALAESFFGIVKTELLYSQSFETADEFITLLKEYIHYYNNKRIKNRLNGKSPVEYRALVQKT